MKKNLRNIAVVTSCLLSFAMCDKIDEPFQDPSNASNGSKKVLIEEFTGHTCGNCPEGSKVLEDIKKVLGDQVIVLAVHSGSFAFPICDQGKYCTDFRTAPGETYLNEFEISSYPTSIVNRKIYNAKIRLPAGDWAPAANAFLAEEDLVDIFIELSLDTNNRNISVEVKSVPLSDLNGNFAVTVALAEDSVPDWQKFYAGILGYENETDVDNYMHRHVFRGNINGNYGEAINTSVAVGDTIYYTAPNTNIPLDFNLKHMSAIAYVHNLDTKEIIDVEKIHFPN